MTFNVAEGDTTVPIAAEPFKLKRLTPVETCGDGACALHSVFGHPDANRGLFATRARFVAKELMGPTMVEASKKGGRCDVAAIGASFWGDFIRPYFDKAGGAEARIFVKSLATHSPELWSEVMKSWQLEREHSRNIGLARAKRREESRSFFSKENEALLVRPVAMRLGYLPSLKDVLVMARDELDQTITQQGEASSSFLHEAYVIDNKGVRRVRGTQKTFPDSGPSCKYTALFDDRECFDALREAFLVEASPHMTTDTFRQTLGDILGEERFSEPDHEHIYGPALNFLDCVNALQPTFDAPSPVPHDFAARAWPAYLDALCNDEYYLSVDELLVICRCAERNVVILKQVDNRLKLAGATGSPGPIVFTKIEDNGRNDEATHMH